VKTQQPITAEEEHRVLQFRPRTLAHRPGQRAELRWQVQQQERSLSRTTCRAMSATAMSRTIFRHRMLANIAAFAFTVALTAIGIWLAMSICGSAPDQDCVLMGRRDCVRISAPHS